MVLDRFRTDEEALADFEVGQTVADGSSTWRSRDVSGPATRGPGRVRTPSSRSSAAARSE